MMNIRHDNGFTRFYIVRHAQSKANERRILGLNPELTDKGMAQAKDVAHELEHIPFTVAFCSSRIRTRQTAELLLGERVLPLIQSEDLVERYFGELEGKTFLDPGSEAFALFQVYAGLDDKTRYTYRMTPGMESSKEVVGRFTQFLKHTTERYQGKTILIVTHGNLMRTFLVHIHFASYAALPPESIENAGYFVLDTDGEKFEVQKTDRINKKLL